jgi:hypothetical protein
MSLHPQLQQKLHKVSLFVHWSVPVFTVKLQWRQRNTSVSVLPAPTLLTGFPSSVNSLLNQPTPFVKFFHNQLI